MWKFAPVLFALAAPAVARAEAAKPFADVEIKLDDPALVTKSAGVHTLFITIYDATSSAPRPYGALKVDLAKDAAKGTIYKGTLDQSNVMVMGGGPAPTKLRIKAKLDKDGSAGPDSAGDLVGTADGVAAGSKAVVTINKAI
jgi:hypothetical protein